MSNTFKNNLFFAIKFSLAVLAAMSFSSCTKVIDIDLKDADKKYVIEGSLTEGTDFARVRITKTSNFFSADAEEVVNDAAVKITMPNSDVVTLNSIGNGYYEATGLAITTESAYALQVDVADKTFTASSYMQASVPIDSIYYEYQAPIFGSDPGYNVFIIYQDELGKNYYQMNSWVNDSLLNGAVDLLVVDDNLNDGNVIEIPVFTHLYEAGDSVEVELQSLDRDLYKFYQTFAAVASENAGSPFSAAPANPETNIVGGALGVFGAYTSSKRTIKIPE